MRQSRKDVLSDKASPRGPLTLIFISILGTKNDRQGDEILGAAQGFGNCRRPALPNPEVPVGSPEGARGTVEPRLPRGAGSVAQGALRPAYPAKGARIPP